MLLSEWQSDLRCETPVEKNLVIFFDFLNFKIFVLENRKIEILKCSDHHYEVLLIRIHHNLLEMLERRIQGM